MTAKVPEPLMSAKSLLARIERAGGRVYRMPEVAVFVLTSDRELAHWLVKMGGKPYVSQGADPADEAGSYLRARRGPREWDIYIHTIPVSGSLSIWEAAGRKGIETVEAVDFA